MEVLILMVKYIINCFVLNHRVILLYNVKKILVIIIRIKQQIQVTKDKRSQIMLLLLIIKIKLKRIRKIKKK